MSTIVQTSRSRVLIRPTSATPVPPSVMTPSTIQKPRMVTMPTILTSTLSTMPQPGTMTSFMMPQCGTMTPLTSSVMTAPPIPTAPTVMTSPIPTSNTCDDYRLPHWYLQRSLWWFGLHHHLTNQPNPTKNRRKPEDLISANIDVLNKLHPHLAQPVGTQGGEGIAQGS